MAEEELHRAQIACSSAWGPDADRRAKLLMHLRWRGALLGSDSISMKFADGIALLSERNQHHANQFSDFRSRSRGSDCRKRRPTRRYGRLFTLWVRNQLWKGRVRYGSASSNSRRNLNLACVAGANATNPGYCIEINGKLSRVSFPKRCFQEPDLIKKRDCKSAVL
jgi:hypothetical protein